MRNHKKNRRGKRIERSQVTKKKLLYTTSGDTKTRRLRRKQQKKRIENLRQKKHFCNYCCRFVCKVGHRNVRRHQKRCKPWLKAERRRVAARLRYARKKAQQNSNNQ